MPLQLEAAPAVTAPAAVRLSRPLPPELGPWLAVHRAALREFPGGHVGLGALPDGRTVLEVGRHVLAPASGVRFVVAVALPAEGDFPATFAVGCGPATLRHGMPVVDPSRWYDLSLRPYPVSDPGDARHRRSLDAWPRRHARACAATESGRAAAHLYETLDFAADARLAKAAIAAAEAMYAAYAVTDGSPRAARAWGRVPVGGNPVSGGVPRVALPRPYVRVVDEAADPAAAASLYRLITRPGVTGEIAPAPLLEAFLDDFMAGLPIYAPVAGRVAARRGEFILLGADGIARHYAGTAAVLSGAPVTAGTLIGHVGPDLRRPSRRLPRRELREAAMAEAVAWAGGAALFEGVLASWLSRQVVETPAGPLMPADLAGTAPLLRPEPGDLFWDFEPVTRFWSDDLGGYLLPPVPSRGPCGDRINVREVDVRLTPPWRL